MIFGPWYSLKYMQMPLMCINMIIILMQQSVRFVAFLWTAIIYEYELNSNNIQYCSNLFINGKQKYDTVKKTTQSYISLNGNCSK